MPGGPERIEALKRANSDTRPTSESASALPILADRVISPCCEISSLSENSGPSQPPADLWLHALASRRPRLVVAGRLGAAAAGQGRARGPVGRGCPRHVRHVGLFPLAGYIGLFGRRDVDGVMDPTVP